MAITKIYKIIDPRSSKVDITDGKDYNGIGGLYGNYTWYHRLVHGSPSRLTRYREYDMMDSDTDVSRAIDIIAEEMTGNNPKTNMPLVIKMYLDGNIKVPSKTVATLNAALKTWCKIHEWNTRIYNISRMTIKYGDTFFLRPKKKNGKYIYTNVKNVVGAVVSESDINDIRGWHIKNDALNSDPNTSGTQLYYNVNSNIGDANVQIYEADEVIRFTLNSDMSDEFPFGKSILASVYRTFKQKELLEDALLIYRIQRAPERRVFYIQTDQVHPAKVAQHLEGIKNEIKQRKIPSSQGGVETVDSIYNPQSMSEDFFFSVGKDGKGSRVEVLPGGQSLGELQDLEYFYEKLWRGLRIPQSYISASAEGGTYADGKVGIAYLQEIKFALYIERLQSQIEETLDREFKRFLRESNIKIDESLFSVMLPQPSNFSVSKQQQMDADLLNTYGSADGIAHLSKRFALKKYLQLTDAELIMNERMLREEKGLAPDGDYRDLPKLYQPSDAESGGFEGGLGSFPSSGGGGLPASGAESGELDDIALDDIESDAGTPDAEEEGDTRNQQNLQS